VNTPSNESMVKLKVDYPCGVACWFRLPLAQQVRCFAGRFCTNSSSAASTSTGHCALLVISCPATIPTIILLTKLSHIHLLPPFLACLSSGSSRNLEGPYFSAFL